MRQCVKFRGDRSNRRRDMAIFRFLKMAAAVISDFSHLKFLAIKRAELRRCAAWPRQMWSNSVIPRNHL